MCCWENYDGGYGVDDTLDQVSEDLRSAVSGSGLVQASLEIYSEIKREIRRLEG